MSEVSDNNGYNPEECDEYDPLSDDLLLAEMIRAIVAYPEKVEVEEYCDATKPQAVKILIVRVDSKDCGKVIGKQGRMAELLRSFMATVGIHHGYSMTVMIDIALLHLYSLLLACVITSLAKRPTGWLHSEAVGSSAWAHFYIGPPPDGLPVVLGAFLGRGVLFAITFVLTFLDFSP